LTREVHVGCEIWDGEGEAIGEREKRNKRREKRNRRRETGEEKQEKRNRRRETGEEKQKITNNTFINRKRRNTPQFHNKVN
jgi:hypothetical protein